MSEPIVIPNVTKEPDTGQTIVSTHQGMVVLHLPKPIEYVVYPPLAALSDGAKLMLASSEADPALHQMVINCAMTLVDLVYEQRGDLKPAGGAAKHELIERHRVALTNAFTTILKTLREQKTYSHHKLATKLVDAACHEIFT